VGATAGFVERHGDLAMRCTQNVQDDAALDPTSSRHRGLLDSGGGGCLGAAKQRHDGPPADAGGTVYGNHRHPVGRLYR
jgi:hypothetical protein